jgi:hypothetical protein
MRKVEQKIKFRTTKKWNWLDYFKVDVSIRILTNVIDYTMLRSSMSHEHLFIFSSWVLHPCPIYRFLLKIEGMTPSEKG